LDFHRVQIDALDDPCSFETTVCVDGECTSTNNNSKPEPRSQEFAAGSAASEELATNEGGATEQLAAIQDNPSAGRETGGDEGSSSE
jgi:hypothetical protein